MSNFLTQFADLKEKLREVRLKKNEEKIKELIKKDQVNPISTGMQALIDQVKQKSIQDAEKNFENLMDKTKKESEQSEIEDHLVKLVKEETKIVGI